MAKATVFVFDFDGVLIDSMNEVTVTCYNLASRSLVSQLEEVPETFRCLFRRNRFHGRRATELNILAHWCLAQHSQDATRILRHQEFLEIAAPQRSQAEPLASEFFATRDRLISAQREHWLKLNAPFQPLWNAVLAHRESDLLILTHKNLRAVLNICEYHGLFPANENVYSGDSGRSKSEHFREIQERFADRQFVFIDDSVSNLIEVQNDPELSAIQVFLAEWGDLGPEDKGQASQHSIETISQANVVDRLDSKV